MADDRCDQRQSIQKMCIRDRLKEKNADAVMIENCGMPGEKIFSKAEDFPDTAGYYSLVIAKEGK